MQTSYAMDRPLLLNDGGGIFLKYNEKAFVMTVIMVTMAIGYL
jgi:hypothetical protein